MPAEPILDYRRFRGYRVRIAVARRLCEREGLPRPRRLTRILRGEVNASFRLDFDAGEPLVLKVWVRTSSPERMQQAAATVRQVRGRTSVPTPAWLCGHPADELIDYPYAVQELAGGDDADTLWPSLDPAQTKRLLGECARALRQLHDARIDVPGPPDAQAWAAADRERFAQALATLRAQGWIDERTLDRAEATWRQDPAVLAGAGPLTFVHYDFQLHNLRVDAASQRIVALLDFDNGSRGPAFTDARDLTLSVLLKDPALAAAFWREYGEPDAGRRRILHLHCLARLLDVLAAYGGPAPGGWDAGTVVKLLAELES